MLISSVFTLLSQCCPSNVYCAPTTVTLNPSVNRLPIPRCGTLDCCCVSGILSILSSFVSVRQVYKCCLYINCHPVVVAEHFSSILNIWCPICGHGVVRIFMNNVLWLVIWCQWLRVCVIQRRYTWIEIVAQFLHWREECKDRNI